MRRIPLVVLFGATAAAALAQTYPPHPEGSAVYDSAGLLSPSDERQISSLSQKFLQDTGAPIVVATFPSLRQVGAQGIGIERYSTELFNRWRIGRSDANGGILLVVARDDHKVRIELGKDWRHDYDAPSRKINQTVILPAFRRGDFSGGILAGAQALAGMANKPAESSVPVGAMDDSSDGGPESLPPSFLFLGGFCCCFAPVLGIIALASRRRQRPIYQRGYPNQTVIYDDPTDDTSFLTGMVVGEIMSSPPVDPQPYIDPTPYDSGSTFDSGSFDSGGGFDSGDSGGGGDTGSW